MRQLVFDELSAGDVDLVRGWLEENAEPSALGDIFWVELPEHVLSELQREHPDGRPYCFAVEIGPDHIKFELLIRSRYSLRHPATGFATEPQRRFILDLTDRLLADLGIMT